MGSLPRRRKRQRGTEKEKKKAKKMVEMIWWSRTRGIGLQGKETEMCPPHVSVIGTCG